jgi:hypothetical protein
MSGRREKNQRRKMTRAMTHQNGGANLMTRDQFGNSATMNKMRLAAIATMIGTARKVMARR